MTYAAEMWDEMSEVERRKILRKIDKGFRVDGTNTKPEWWTEETVVKWSKFPFEDLKTELVQFLNLYFRRPGDFTKFPAE